MPSNTAWGHLLVLGIWIVIMSPVLLKIPKIVRFMRTFHWSDLRIQVRRVRRKS